MCVRTCEVYVARRSSLINHFCHTSDQVILKCATFSELPVMLPNLSTLRLTTPISAPLPPSRLIVRGADADQAKALAVFAWTHHWDGLINLYRVHGQDAWSFFQFENKDEFVAIIAYFCPLDLLRDVFEMPRLQERSIVVSRVDGDGSDQCPLILSVDDDEDTSNLALEQMLRRVLLVDLAEDESARNVLLGTLERLEAALTASCNVLGSPQTLFRRIKTSSDVDRIKERMERSWNATSVNEVFTRSFCADNNNDNNDDNYVAFGEESDSATTDDDDCVLVILQAAANTLVVKPDDVLPEEWICYTNEQEVLLPPGCTFTLAEIPNARAVRYTVYLFRVDGGFDGTFEDNGRPSWFSRTLDENEDSVAVENFWSAQRETRLGEANVYEP